MKKLTALFLVLTLLLCALPAAVAEEAAAPALNLPITLEDYMASYEAVITEAVPGCTVSWTSAPLDEGECWMATINGSFISVMLMPVDGQVSEIAVLMQTGLDETSLMTFLSMAGYAGAALLRSESVTSLEACDAFMAELMSMFSAIYAGEAPTSIYGLPGMINLTPMQDGTCQFYFILKLTPAEAE